MTAAVRKTPTQANGGVTDGIGYANAVDAEVQWLAKTSVQWLTGVAGTNAITASSDTAVVAAITAYTRGMAFWLVPEITNTGAVTITIDSVGVVDLKSKANASLGSGAVVASSIYLIMFDGTAFRLVA